MRACYAGCQNSDGPIEATRGVLCERCFEGIEKALDEVEAVMLHLRDVYSMLPARSEDGSQRVAKDPPAPLNLHALQLTEQITYAILERYIGSGLSGAETAEIIGDEAMKIQKNLLQVANSRQVVSLLPLPRLIRHANQAFPRQERSRVTALPCPQCNKRTIYTPPEARGDNLEVVCFDCGFRIPPEKMEFYANLAEREAAK